MTVREKAELIVKDIKKEQGTNPVVIFKQIAKKEYVSIHGPEHHILDGASLLVAYKNAGGEIDLEQALDRLMAEGLRMPGCFVLSIGSCRIPKGEVTKRNSSRSTGNEYSDRKSVV